MALMMDGNVYSWDDTSTYHKVYSTDNHEHHCVECERLIVCDLIGCEDDTDWRCVECLEAMLEDMVRRCNQ